MRLVSIIQGVAVPCLVLFLVVPAVLGSAGPLDNPAVFPRFTETRDVEDVAESSATPRFRLPNKIMPRHYKLNIRPILTEGDPNRFKAPGTVEITVECLESTSELVMNAAELDINATSVKVYRDDIPTEVLTVVNQTFNTEELVQSYTIHVQETLTVGIFYRIYIEFTAIVADPILQRMNGVYWSSYRVDSGETKYLATTQFSRTRGFRKTLPSFDEPNQKAKFDISIGRETSYHSLSNMNQIGSEPISGLPGWVWDHYNTTPIMSPTIIAFIVSDFANETADPNLYNPDKPVKIWGPPPEIQGNGGVFAAEAAAKTLKYFEEHFGVEYELPKIDSAALPDFAAGAMENWGLNTYRVMYLIWKEGVNTVAEKFRIANIIGHELAHQFWGNLVTHAWWNDWWLTEGFASYYEYRSVDAIDTDFQAVERVTTSDIQPAMEYDAGPNSVPIHGPNDTHFVENPAAINYNKGASLVNMMRSFITDDVFRQACNHYLTKRAYTAVHQNALFDDLTEYLRMNNAMPTNNKTVNEIMETWTLQTGFPMVKVSKAGPNHIFVSQERFQNLLTQAPVAPLADLWHVPIFYITGADPAFDKNNHAPKFWLDKDALMTTHAVDTSQWILVNTDGQGYYRVLYDTALELLLRTQLETSITPIPVGSRSMIVDDYFHAAYNGYIEMNRALNMTLFMSNEVNFNVWVPFMKHLTRAYQLFGEDSVNFVPFRTWILGTMQTALNSIGFVQLPAEPPMNTILRVQLYNWACPLFDPGCVTAAETLLEQWKANPTVNPVPVDIRSAMYCASTSNVSTGNWDFLMTQYNSTNDPLIRDSLACTQDVVQIDAIISKVISETLPTGHAVSLTERLATSAEGRSALITALSLEFTALIAEDKLGVAGIVRMISAICSNTPNTATRNQIQTILNVNPGSFPEPEMAQINASLARVATNEQWMQNFGNSILTWLSTP